MDETALYLEFLAAVAREVVEFGPLNETIHKVDECVSTADLCQLADILTETVRQRLTPA